MMREKYAMMFFPTEETSEYLREITNQVCIRNSGLKPRNSDSHISFGSQFYCEDIDEFLKETSSYLKEQESFILHLDKVDNFNGTVYLTSSYRKENENINIILNGINEIKHRNEVEIINEDFDNNYIPHITLLKVFKPREIKKIKKGVCREMKNKEILYLKIDEILLKRTVNGRWKDLYIFTIGSGETKNNDIVTLDSLAVPYEFQSPESDRASIQQSYRHE